ncbi:hypothetical protein R2F25_17760 [Streptomyces sp. UP1A-1]|nr:hypothetical protein [Streptomyces sp. UP1A-1]
MPVSPPPPRARYERGAARVFGPDGKPAGAGFLVAEDLLCTCAHVVATADGERPEDPVEVDFPLLARRPAGPPGPGPGDVLAARGRHRRTAAGGGGGGDRAAAPGG